MYKINEDEFVMRMLWILSIINEQLEEIANIDRQLIYMFN